MQSTTELSESRQADTPAAQLNFAELFEQLYPRVFNYLRYRVNVPEDAEDLIGVVFEKAFTHRAQFDPAKGEFSTWLFRIAHNTLANYYRSRQRSSVWESDAAPPEDMPQQGASPEAQIIRQEAVAHLLEGLGQLSERDQEIISLKFAGRLSNREIGEIIDMKEKTVSVALLRAMRRLQKIVQERPA
ncbi:MAG: sigma-70 family RNA polymerase sigma factor [Anaerolineae bacterium]